MKLYSLFIGCVLLLPLTTSALELRSTNTFTVAAKQITSNELWLAADVIKFQGTAERALFLQALNTELAGVFHRDIWALADTVEFSGQAAQALRVATRRSTQITGRINGGLIAAGETVQIQKGAQIGEDAMLLGQDVIMEGVVSNRLVALGNRITLAGQVGGNARLIAEEITLMPGTVICGDLIYTSAKELLPGKDVTIAGKLTHQTKTNAEFSLPTPTLTQRLLIQFALLMAALFVGLPFVALFPLFTTRAVAQLRTQPNKCLLTGAIALALLPMLGVMAIFTWIGLPLGAMLLGTFATLLYLSKIIVAIPLAGRLLSFRRTSSSPLNALPILALGLFLLYLGAALPIVGFAVSLIVVLYGLGALVLALLSGEKSLAISAPTEPPPLNEFRS